MRGVERGAGIEGGCWRCFWNKVNHHKELFLSQNISRKFECGGGVVFCHKKKFPIVGRVL